MINSAQLTSHARVALHVLTTAVVVLLMTGSARFQLEDPYADQPLDELIPGFSFPPRLWIGSPAPPLMIHDYVKGDPVDQFTEGQVWVIEFWSSWCGACLPWNEHLSELQEQHKDKMTVIAVNIAEQNPDNNSVHLPGELRSEIMTRFMEANGGEMRFRVAVEEGVSMYTSWMVAASRNTIPSTFIIDQSLRIAWVGHPEDMDEPLQQILDGTVDPERIKSDARHEYEKTAAVGAFYDLIHVLPWDPATDRPERAIRAMAIARIICHDHLMDTPRVISSLAEAVFHERCKYPDIEGAMRIARHANKLAMARDHYCLSVLAEAHLRSGDRASAAVLQTRADSLFAVSPDKESRYYHDMYTERRARIDGSGE